MLMYPNNGNVFAMSYTENGCQYIFSCCSTRSLTYNLPLIRATASPYVICAPTLFSTAARGRSSRGVTNVRGRD